MKNNKLITAIILVAGNSTRYGKNRNKNFERVNGKTILSYSLEAFDKNNLVDNIIVATKENEVKDVEKILNENKIEKDVNIVIGGKSRKESVYNCITSTDSDIVLIHDGARPIIKQDYINSCIENINEFKGVTVGVKTKDTIKITDDNNIVVNTTKRENTWVIQTPQCFDRKTLVEVHEKYKDCEVTDDCKLLEMDNYKVKIIEGDYSNIKLTNYEDLNIINTLTKIN